MTYLPFLARFCLLEQHLPDGPDHPFAQTMLKHFEKLRTPLHTIGTIDQMRERFVSTGWESDRVLIQTLWELWSDDTFLSSQERRSLDKVEPFDEWEEFALFGSHYFLLEARTGSAPLNDRSIEDYLRPTEAPRTEWKSEALTDCVSLKRRFAAAIRPAPNMPEQATVGHAGGLGPLERL